MTQPLQPAAQRGPKPIATLPPLPVLQQHDAVSPRTGVPARNATITVGHVLFQVAVLGVAVAYGWHFYRAVNTETYLASAHLIGWLDPEPGKWLSLTLEGAIAALTALTGGALGVAGFQAWNGWRWSRWLGVFAVALTGAYTALVSWVGLAAVIPAALAAIALFLPASSQFFAQFARHRRRQPDRYRRPEHVFYGRLPRFR